MPPKKQPKAKPATKPANKKSKGMTEEKMLKIQQAKEKRSLDLFYKLATPEPEEESLEQKIARNKKELKDNTFK